MSLKDTFALHVIFWVYLIAGSVVFYFIDGKPLGSQSPQLNETAASVLCMNLIRAVKEDLGDRVHLEDEDMLLLKCNNLTAVKPVNEPESWDFSAALFLAMTVITTIGYGNLVPTTTCGKIFCIVYGFIGIPLAGILLASTSHYFSNYLLHLYNRQRRRYKNEKLAIAVATVVYLVPGLIIFVFVPAGIFTTLEGWSFVDGFYFSFVTLATIGFGDLVAAQHGAATWIWLYRLAAVCWIIIGLGYWAMIVGFVTKAFKSKELREKWRRTTTAIASQAEEMRKALEHVSINQHNNEFLSFTSKALFHSVVKLAGSVAHISPNLQDQLSPPGIAAALQPHRGIHALMELPVLMLGRQKRVTLAQTAESSHFSFDSGLELDIFSSSRDLSGSCSSLPVVSPSAESQQPRRVPLRRSATRPELLGPMESDNQTCLKGLLVEAIAIIHEMELRCSKEDTALSGSDE